MKVGSLFAGIGGFDLAASRVWGWDCIRWQVEIDPWCRRVLAKHWPDVKRYGDIREIDGGDLEPVDLVCGGFPCQPVSLAGRRLGSADDRWLWPEMARLVSVIQPAWVVGENVPGLLGMGHEQVCADLEAAGYEVWTLGIPAVAVGAPHVRERLWIVAHAERSERRSGEPGRDDANRPVGVGEEATSRAGTPDPNGRARPLADPQEQSERAGLRPSPPGGLGRGRSGNDGSEGNPASDAQGVGCRPGRQRRSVGVPAGLRDTAGALADPDRERCQELDLSRVAGDAGQPAGRVDSLRGWWATEPGMGRVADGIPRRVDRLRGLGNAVVPQVPEMLFRWIGATP